MKDLKLLRQIVADEKGMSTIMGPLLAALIRNALRDLLHYEEQIIKRGFAVPSNLQEVEHTKGGRYLIVTDKNVKLEADWSDGVAYLPATDADGPLVIRNKEEFWDGRFTKVETQTNSIEDRATG